jgi:hypothetical protein
VTLGAYGSAESMGRYNALLELWRRLPTPVATHPTRPAGPVLTLPTLAETIAPATALIPLADVPRIRWLPRQPSVRTVERWHRQGLRGFYLECVRVAGQLFTSEAAVLSFAYRCAAPVPPTDAQVHRALNLIACQRAGLPMPAHR